jgi:endonuclease/exonuclease/phosphatase family metal-dependent hydrolase
MSFNIRNQRARDGANGWELRRELLFEVIRRHNPDVMGIQEAYCEQVAQLKQALPEYAGVGVGRDDGDTEGEYCAIFFRRDRFQAEAQDTFWFSDTPDVPGSRHWTREHARICTWVRLREAAGKAVTVYNVHLDHESAAAREKSIRLLLERSQAQEPAGPVLILGDFNMYEDDPALALLTESRSPQLQETFRRVHPDAKETATFHGFTGSVTGEKIDYIFASSEFSVQEARILHDNVEGRYPSDHFPLTAHVLLRETQG